MKRSILTTQQERRLGIRVRVSLGVGTVAMVGPAWAAASGHHGWPYAVLPAACVGYAVSGVMRVNRSDNAAFAQAKAEADAQRLAVQAEVEAWWDGGDGQPQPVTITVVQVPTPTPDPLPRLELVQSFEEKPEMEPAL